MDILIWMIAAGVLLIVVGVVWLATFLEQRRASQIQTVGRELGFESLAVLPTDLDGCRARFTLFNTGRSRKLANILFRQAEGLQLLLFDYYYTTGGGKNHHRHKQTVALFRSAELRLPQFKMVPEGWLSRLTHVFGAQDIDFDDAPEFSAGFQLSGSNEAAIREYFRADQLTALTSYDRLCVEAAEDVATIWFQGRRIPAAGVTEFFEKTFEVYSILKSPQL